MVNVVISLFDRQVGNFLEAFKAISRSGKGKNSGFTSIVFLFKCQFYPKKKHLIKFTQVINLCCIPRLLWGKAFIILC